MEHFGYARCLHINQFVLSSNIWLNSCIMVCEFLTWQYRHTSLLRSPRKQWFYVEVFKLQQVLDTNITVCIRHIYYSKYSTQILQQVFDTNMTVSIRQDIAAKIRHKCYSKYSTQILQQVFDTIITASFRHKYLQKGFDTNIYKKDSRQIVS